MSQSRMVVSVACITYNHEKYIAQALDSFLMQETNFDYEIVIGEDCSTDGTLAIIHEYQAKYPNKIRVVSSAGNVGLAKNFIRTLGACEGEYIAYCDCDDYWTDPIKLQKQYDCLEANSQAVACFHAVDDVDDSGRVTKAYRPRHDHYHEYSRYEMMICYPKLAHQAIFFRNIINFDNYPKEALYSINQDTFLFSILGLYGTGIYLADISPSAYRAHASSIWTSANNEFMLNHSATTDLWKATLFANKGEAKVARHYRKRSLRRLMRMSSRSSVFILAILRILRGK